MKQTTRSFSFGDSDTSTIVYVLTGGAAMILIMVVAYCIMRFARRSCDHFEETLARGPQQQPKKPLRAKHQNGNVNYQSVWYISDLCHLLLRPSYVIHSDDFTRPTNLIPNLSCTSVYSCNK